MLTATQCRKRAFIGQNESTLKRRKINATATTKQSSNLQKDTWNKVLSYNKNKLSQVPQWISCKKCKQWRTIPVPISKVKQWNTPSNWSCPPYICGKLRPAPSGKTHTQFELFALSVQRCLNILKVNHSTQNMKSLNDTLQSYTNKMQNAQTAMKHKIENIKSAKLQKELNEKNSIIQDLKNKLTNLTQSNRTEMNCLRSEKITLIQKNAEMTKKLNLLNGTSDLVKTMSLEELNGLLAESQKGMEKINKTRETLLQNSLYCVICYGNPKNVVIHNCGHFDLCHECLHRLPLRICPRCQTPFQSITLVNH